MLSPLPDSVPEIIDRMLRFGRTSIGNTAQFRLLRHDRDLLPQFQRQLERVLESYGKFSPITYDTQGIRDQGVDIVVRRHDEDEQYHSLIGLQIKATDDLLAKDYMKTLKSQRYDSSRIKDLLQYYIVLCVDQDSNKDRIRAIESEFKDAERTKIIEPTFADFFLSLSQHRIDAYIRRASMSGDVVLKRALEIVKFDSRMTGALLIYLTVHSHVRSDSIDIRTVRDSNVLRTLHGHLLSEADADDNLAEDTADAEAEDVIEFLSVSEVGSDFDSQINRDLDILTDGPIVIEGETINVRFDQVVPIVALATEAMVRYDYESDTVIPYLLDLLNLSADQRPIQ